MEPPNDNEEENQIKETIVDPLMTFFAELSDLKHPISSTLILFLFLILPDFLSSFELDLSSIKNEFLYFFILFTL